VNTYVSKKLEIRQKN